MTSVITIPALGDNFIYLYRYDEDKTLAVDPGESSSVLRLLKKHALRLTIILLTHHHGDHVFGASDLQNKTGCRILGPDKQRIPFIDQVKDEKQPLTLGKQTLQVIATPGHTSTSVCYYLPPSDDNKSGVVFTGDTLFVGGCGRLFQDDALSMWQSLNKLKSLPDQTLIYCGHDYTRENYEFALSIAPENKTIQNLLEDIKQKQREGKPTAPSTIAREKQINIFLRADSPEIKTALNMPHAADAEVFAELRKRKNIFG